MARGSHQARVKIRSHLAQSRSNESRCRMVRLVSMKATEFESYRAVSIREYAEEKVQAGNWQPEEALERSTKEFQQLLPEGVAIKENYLYNIEDEALGAKVGMIWLARMMQGAKPIVFIYDFRIDEAHRRKGYGEQAMFAAEVQAKALGYEITNINMAKKLTA
jgi:RimJ/RimL family protein N-acetyltransferase